MVDRTDIDALLIGSLYGELSDADEGRLHAHLESHPVDRAALANLTQAREAVHRSRILQVQFEPPQSVSALLLQEAARRAPRRAPDDAKREGWFQRFVRSFAAQPAMAAAAMLVLVLGVAGTLYVRGGGHPHVEPAATEPATTGPAVTEEHLDPVAESQPVTPPAPRDRTRDDAHEAAAPTTAAVGGDANGAATASPTGGQAASGSSFPVQLAQDVEDKTDPSSEQSGRKNEASRSKTAATKTDGKQTQGRYIQINPPPPPAPKELEEEKLKGGLATSTSGTTKPATKPARTPPTPADEDADLGRFRGASGSAPAVVGSAPPSAPPPRAAGVVERAERAERSSQAPPRAAPAPAQNQVARTVDRGPSADRPADAKSSEDIVWAKGVHEKLLGLARANNCAGVASLAVALQNRAPHYYALNVETDRTLKQCGAYIAQEREREVERAQQRARATKRAAEEPAKVDSAKPTNR